MKISIIIHGVAWSAQLSIEIDLEFPLPRCYSGLAQISSTRPAIVRPATFGRSPHFPSRSISWLILFVLESFKIDGPDADIQEHWLILDDRAIYNIELN
jgi:hypothetical protein